jgi:hypothetical protein
MKRKMKRARVEPLHLLRDRCDKLWREVIFKRQGVKCLVCKERPASQAHHIFHKGANNLFRYRLANGLAICTGCHLRERYNPTPVVMAAIAHHGETIRSLWLGVRAQGGAHTWTRAELEQVEREFSSALGLLPKEAADGPESAA